MKKLLLIVGLLFTLPNHAHGPGFELSFKLPIPFYIATSLATGGTALIGIKEIIETMITTPDASDDTSLNGKLIVTYGVLIYMLSRASWLSWNAAHEEISLISHS